MCMDALETPIISRCQKRFAVLPNIGHSSREQERDIDRERDRARVRYRERAREIDH